MDTLDDSYILDSASTISLNSSAFNSPASSTRAGSPSLSNSASLGLESSAGLEAGAPAHSHDSALSAGDSLQPSLIANDATSSSIPSTSRNSASTAAVQDPFSAHPIVRPTPRRVSPPVTRPCTPSIDSPAPSSPHLAFPSFPPSPLPHPGRKRASTDGSSSGGNSEEHEGRSSAAEEDEDDDRGLGLRMPSMSLGRARLASAGTRSTNGEIPGKSHPMHPTRILLLGKTAQDRSTLAHHLLEDEVSSGRSPAEQGDGDVPSMSASFLSTDSGARFSDRSRSRSSSGRNLLVEVGKDEEVGLEEQQGPWELLSCRGGVSLLQPPAELLSDDRTRQALLTPLEKMESKLNSYYPSSSGLAQLVMDGADRAMLDCCLVLMSSPPTAAEVTLARHISHLLPLYPILVLPPSPASSGSKKFKPQKTAALVQAVSTQITKAGVRWLPAPSALSTAAGVAIHLLPHELFLSPVPSVHDHPRHEVHEGSGPPSSAMPASLASSQELVPPSPTFTSASSAASSNSSTNSSSSRSRSPCSSGEVSAPDLARLRRLTALAQDDSAIEARQSLRKSKALSFLEWRDVEIAARGSSVLRGKGSGRWEISDLPSAWNEQPVEQQEASRDSRTREEQLERELQFSRRVAERRRELRRPRSQPTKEQRSDAEEDDEISNLSDTLPAPYTRPNQPGSSLLTDVTTPRCPGPGPAPSRFPFPLAPFAPSSGSLSSSMHSAHSHTYTATSDPLPAFPSPSLASYAPSTSSSFILTQPIATVDPFHLPSLLHLVGLNIRMSLMPTVVELSDRAMGVDAEKDSACWRAAGARSWFSTVAILGVVFLAGALVGVGVAGGADGAGVRFGGGAGWWKAGLGLGFGGRLAK